MLRHLHFKIKSWGVVMEKLTKIFISFASQERDLAIQLREFILMAFPKQFSEESIFVSDTTITPGELWETVIKKAIKEAELVFVLCSPLSISRQWVNFECGAASFNIPLPHIIPLCHSGLRKDKLISFADWVKEEAIDVHSLNFLDEVCSRIKDKFEIKVIENKEETDKKAQKIADFITKFDQVLQDMARRIDKKEEKERKKKKDKSPLFEEHDIENPLFLITKLQSDTIPSTMLASQFIWAKFDPATKTSLTDPESTSPQRQSSLIQALNKILQGDSIHELTRFNGVTLRRETQSLITQSPVSERLIRFNRLLLEDTYPQEIKRIPTWPPIYLCVNINIEKDPANSIRVTYAGVSDPVEAPMQNEKTWLDKVKKMHEFVTNRSDRVDCTGIAIGVQNCLYDGNHIYVGVRMKSMKDAYSSSMGVAKGKFNTGYELLSSESERKIESINSMQDLFVAMPKYIKKPVQPNSKIDYEKNLYDAIKERVETVNSRLWNIVFADDSTGVASIFINNSNWFPRLEIGIWKFIDISGLDNSGIIDGFGEDVFLDYRGREDTQETPVNYWIWVKDGEICYWSYPEERLIPRKKPGKPPENPMHAVLVKAEYMNNVYGNPFRYTPFASDEKLTNYSDAVLADQFSLPARVLLSCF